MQENSDNEEASEQMRDIVEDESSALLPNEHDGLVNESYEEPLWPGAYGKSEGELYEAAISSTGFGYFHIILLVICGWAVASDAVEIQAVSFVLPSACDLHLTSTDKGWLNGIIFVGMMVGGYTFGGIADVKGRRYVLMWSLTINGVFGLCSSFSSSFGMFLAFRFLSGIGVGAAMPVVFAYFTEFLAKERRGPLIGLLATFWMGGNIVTAGLAWITIPNVGIGTRVGNIWFGNWRIFVALCAIPSISSAIFLFLMPESPKFLQKVGKYADAADVFTRIYISNKKRNDIPSEILVFYNMQSSKERMAHKEMGSMKHGGSLFSSVTITIQKIVHSTAELFKKPLAARFWISLFIWFTLSFGYYGLWMWFPELFQRIQSGQSSCGNNVSPVVLSNETLTCVEKMKYSNFVYFESFLVAASNLPGNLITIFMINIIGRRFMMASSMVICGVSVFFFWFVKNKTEMLVMSCIFSGLATAGWNSLDVLCMELFPTHLRSTAFGLQAAIGRIGSILANAVFGELVDVHCSVPLLLVAGLLATGGLSALKLPKTDNDALQ